MALYRYIKAPIVVINHEVPKGHRWSKLAAPVLLTVGSLLLANVIWPVMWYQLMSSPALQRVELISPVPKDELGSTPLIAEINPPPSPIIPQVLSADLDYSKVSNWFPGAVQMGVTEVKSYTISIPSLRINNATVTVGGESLDKSLIHYAGTALPGQLGSPVIFGHSVLRQFYDPGEKNPRRYLSIFSKIMTLKNGDRIFIDYDGIKYTYEVKDKVEVHPEDLFILEQKYSNRELKLITCVPEGTYLRRGVIVAQLVDLK